MQVLDFAVDEGVRTVARQAALVKDGLTQTMQSKHLIQPDGFGHAVDLSPSPMVWERAATGAYRLIAGFGGFAVVLLLVANLGGAVVATGTERDGDGSTSAHTIFVGAHFHVVVI